MERSGGSEDPAALEAMLPGLGARLDEALEVSRLEGDRLDHLIALLKLYDVPVQSIASQLPANVVRSRRKVLDATPLPGWLQRAGAPALVAPADKTPTAQQRTTESGMLLATARERMRSPQQAAVLDFVTRWTTDPSSSGDLTPSKVQEALLQQGTRIAPKTARQALRKLADLQILEPVGRAVYRLRGRDAGVWAQQPDSPIAIDEVDARRAPSSAPKQERTREERSP